MSGPESGAERETITIHELLERSARAALDLQREDGSFPPGRNGVYDEPETPVRTTSHWLTTLSKVYEITGDEEFAEAANDAADYLLSEEARPHGYTFHSRNVEGKDKCDGLVGQAAPIRGLAWAGFVLERTELHETAAEVFDLHPFDDRLGMWERVEIDGTKLSFDRTLNHQIAFAAASTHLTELSSSATVRIGQFLDRLDVNLRTHSEGLIKHYVRPRPIDSLRTAVSTPRHWRLVLNEVVFHYYSRSSQRRRKEIGYHSVNLSGLSALKKRFPDHGFWRSDPIDAVVSYVHSDEYRGNVFEVPSGSMLPGIETAVGLSALDNTADVTSWIARDVNEKFDFKQNMFVRQASDPVSQATKIYNLTTLPDQRIDLA